MVEKFIVLGYGVGKEDGKPYSSLKRINEGKSKDGKPYGFVDVKSFESVSEDEMLPIGTIISYKRQRADKAGVNSTDEDIFNDDDEDIFGDGK